MIPWWARNGREVRMVVSCPPCWPPAPVANPANLPIRAPEAFEKRERKRAVEAGISDQGDERNGRAEHLVAMYGRASLQSAGDR